MSDLRLNLKPLGFDELGPLGRSLIPTLAPEWNDHNTHDPGMMLIDLVSWIAEAQMYSLSRLRRDERVGYARFLGVTPRGPVPARGLIWPRDDERGQAAPPSWEEGVVLPAGTMAAADRGDAPAFATAQTVALTTARLVRVETRFADGTSHDWTTSNVRDGATFSPFGENPAPGDRLMPHLRDEGGRRSRIQEPAVAGLRDSERRRTAGRRPDAGAAGSADGLTRE